MFFVTFIHTFVMGCIPGHNTLTEHALTHLLDKLGWLFRHTPYYFPIAGMDISTCPLDLASEFLKKGFLAIAR